MCSGTTILKFKSMRSITKNISSRTVSKTVFILSIFISIVGCVSGSRSSGYKQFYSDKIGVQVTNCLPYSGVTKIYTSQDLARDIKEAYRNSHYMIGQAAFTGPAQSDADLLTQGKLVGADLVLVYSLHLGSEQRMVPWVTYHPGQSITTTMSGNVSANAWGSGGNVYGSGNYNGTATTTTPGTYSTQAMPVTVHTYQYQAAFFRKHKPLLFGVFGRPTNEDIRKKLEINTGVIAELVETGSPAFSANILEGDVLLKMNGEVLSSGDLSVKSRKFNGQNVEIEIWRNGEFKKIPVKLRSSDAN